MMSVSLSLFSLRLGMRKKEAFLICRVMLAAACFQVGGSTFAATLTWGGGAINIADGTPPAGGVGTWNTSTLNWSADSIGTSYTAWSNGAPDSAIFAGIGGVVTVGTAITAGDLQFNATGYTLRLNSFGINATGLSGANFNNLIVDITGGSSNTLGLNLSSDLTWSGTLRSTSTTSSRQLTLQKDGSGTLVFDGTAQTRTTNSDGRVRFGLSAGTLRLGSNFRNINETGSAAGRMRLNQTGGTFDVNGGNKAGGSIGTSLIFDTFAFTGGVITDSRAMGTPANLVLNTGNSNTTFGGSLTGRLGVSKTNNGSGSTLTFNGPVNVTGTIESGRGITFAAAAAPVIGRLNLSGIDAATTSFASNATVGSLDSTSANKTVSIGANTLTVGSDTEPDGSFAGAVNGIGGNLVKQGSNAQILSGSNGYTGTTTINEGVLRIQGSLASSSVAVNSGGVIGGSGTLAGSLTLNSSSTASPGNSPGVLSTGSQTWNDGANYNWQLFDANGSAGTAYDTMNITGSLDLTGLTGILDFNINLWTLSSIGPDVNGLALNFDSLSNYNWTLASTTAGILGFEASDFTINTAPINGTGGFANPFTGNFEVGVSGNDLVLTYTPVPEPSAFQVAALVASVIFTWRCRSRRNF
jgi:autotransporter-associated beta strand protein